METHQAQAFKTATTEGLPGAVVVMDPFHVVHLGGYALDQCQRRVQQDFHGHRGCEDDPLYRARRLLRTSADLFTEKQQDRLKALFAVDTHVEVEVTWSIYQRMIAAYRYADRRQGRALMVKLINSISSGVPKLLTEIITLGRTLKNQSVDVLDSLDGPRHIQRTDRDDQRLPRAPMRLSTPITKPHQLHRQITAQN